jgi:hypothetical protein
MRSWVHFPELEKKKKKKTKKEKIGLTGNLVIL